MVFHISHLAGRVEDNNDNPLTEGISGVTVNIESSGGGDELKVLSQLRNCHLTSMHHKIEPLHQLTMKLLFQDCMVKLNQ